MEKEKETGHVHIVYLKNSPSCIIITLFYFDHPEAREDWIQVYDSINVVQTREVVDRGEALLLITGLFIMEVSRDRLDFGTSP